MAGPERYGANPIAQALRALLGAAEANQQMKNEPRAVEAFQRLLSARQESPALNDDVKESIVRSDTKLSPDLTLFDLIRAGAIAPAEPTSADLSGSLTREGELRYGKNNYWAVNGTYWTIPDYSRSPLKELTYEQVQDRLEKAQAAEVPRIERDLVKSLGPTEQDQREEAIKLFLQSVGKTE